MKARSLLRQGLVNLFKHFPLAFLANVFYGWPAKKLKVIGVTGTDGKTTTVSLIYHLLKEVGLSSAMVSTVSAKIKNEEIDTGFHVTEPNPWELQKLLRRMVNEGINYVVLEVSSHGLDQYRDFGIAYEVGVVTNITHDHFDYHKNYKNYLTAKARLFEKSKISVLNKDDQSFNYLTAKIKSKTITYSLKSAADFTLKKFPFKTALPGEFNQYNCLAAIAAASALGVSEKKIKEAVSLFKGVTGRMEEINEGQNFKAIVDFASTPNSLEQALIALRKQLKKGARLIAVFGSAGLRDIEKRSMMGEISAKYADLSVLTAEDPRTEDVNKIIEQIAEGCRTNNGIEGKTFFKIPDRQEAIIFAIQKLAKPNDIVVTCGKGHERSMCIGTTEYPWNEQEAVKKALKERINK